MNVIALLFEVAMRADDALSKLPFYGASRSWVLDRMFGPAEDFEYVSRTTPPD